MATPPALADKPGTGTQTCDGNELTYRQQPSNAGFNWGSVQVVDGGTGHLTPTVQTFVLYDWTADVVLLESSSANGRGHSHSQQNTTDCTVEFDATLADLLWAFEELPPGTSPTDEVTLTFTVTVVRKN